LAGARNRAGLFLCAGVTARYLFITRRRSAGGVSPTTFHRLVLEASVDRHHRQPIPRSVVELVAILLCSVQASGIALFLERQSAVAGGLPLVDSPGWVFRLTTVVVLTCGMAALMWLSDAITERGLGNGMFLTFLAGVLVGLPGALSAASRLAHAGLLDFSGAWPMWAGSRSPSPSWRRQRTSIVPPRCRAR
jgi:preprotein translocase subunit SecY